MDWIMQSTHKAKEETKIISYHLINKNKPYHWREFTDTNVIIKQGKNTVKLGQKELNKLEKVIGAKFQL